MSTEGASSLGGKGPWTCFPEKFCRKSVNYGNKSLENKNKSNEIILMGFFLKVEGDFPFLDVQKGVVHVCY